MENTPTIILFWLFIAAFFVLALVLTITGIVIHKKDRNKVPTKVQILGKLCLALSAIFYVPIILVIGYVLYIRIC
ncbi:MAG: hypothetical protein IJE09_07815 [Oscillospiraceae bacterium]|nr:hypothetical protein [Oscillospiraceae bacterium]